MPFNPSWRRKVPPIIIRNSPPKFKPAPEVEMMAAGIKMNIHKPENETLISSLTIDLTHRQFAKEVTPKQVFSPP